jgi:hypothetical protein
MVLPAGNERIYFAGEALSLRHAWVEGALNSAWRAIFFFCVANKVDTKDLFIKWGVDGEYAPSPRILDSECVPQDKAKSGESKQIPTNQILRNSPLLRFVAANASAQ